MAVEWALGGWCCSGETASRMFLEEEEVVREWAEVGVGVLGERTEFGTGDA